MLLHCSKSNLQEVFLEAKHVVQFYQTIQGNKLRNSFFTLTPCTRQRYQSNSRHIDNLYLLHRTYSLCYSINVFIVEDKLLV